MDDFNEEDVAKFLAFMRTQQASSSTVTATIVTKSPEPDIKATPHHQTDTATPHHQTHTGSDDEENCGLKNNFIIEERLQALTSRGKFYEAISLFEDIASVDDNDIGIKLLMAECYIQLGRESRAEKAVGAVEKILMTPPMCDVDDVMDLALDFSNNANYIRALLLLRIASDMLFNSKLSPDDKIEKIFRCLRKMDKVIDGMVKPSDATDDAQSISAIQKALGLDGDSDIDVSKIFGKKKKSSGISERTRVLSLDYGVEVMEEMLKKIDLIKHSDLVFKTLKIAGAAIVINSHYKGPSQFSNAVKVLKFALERMETQFGKDANHYRLYGQLLYVLGSDYHDSEKHREAEVYASRALQSYEYATDFESEEHKRKTIKTNQNSLRIVRSHKKFA